MIRTLGLQVQMPGGPCIAFPDADVPQGGVLLLRGPSGSGKSTWLSLVAGLLTPTGGHLTVAGTCLHDSGGAGRCVLATGRQRDAWRAAHVGCPPGAAHRPSAKDHAALHCAELSCAVLRCAGVHCLHPARPTVPAG